MPVNLSQVVRLSGPLEDLSTLLSDQPLGTPEDFSIDADPDDDLIDTSDVEVEMRSTLADLESLTLWYILRDQFGEDWWQNDAQAIVDVLGDVFHIDKGGKDMIQSLRLLEANNGFWKEWEVFNYICQGVNGDGVDFYRLPVPTIPEMAEAMLLADFLLRARNDKQSYSREVLSYIAVTCLEEGLWVLPYPLNRAQPRVIEILTSRTANFPLYRESIIRRGNSLLTSEEEAQSEMHDALKREVEEIVKESVRELESYKRATDG